MSFRAFPSLPLVAAASFLFLSACEGDPSPRGSTGAAGAGTTGAAGMGMTGAAGNGTTGAAGTGTTGAAGTGAAGSGTTGAAGTGVTGAAGTGAAGTGAAGMGTAGTGAAGTGAAGTGAAGTGAGAGAAGTGAAGATGAAGVGNTDPPPPRAINVTPGNVYQGGGLRLDKSKPIVGKLVLYLGGICGGTGAGGIESFVNGFGFHTYAPSTQTCVNGGDGGHKMYRDMLTDNDPSNDALANRIVGDARMELWDGVDRVPFVTVNKGESIVERTVAALKNGMVMDPGGDWGYFLNTDGTLRTTDVYVVGYSWGSQTWAMISSYVRFGKVICTSGPQAEGFPNADWILKPGPNRTPPDRQFTLLGFMVGYPATSGVDAAPNNVMSMIETTTKAGWLGPPINVHPGDLGPFTGHQIAMDGSNGQSPGGHTIFCTNGATNGWRYLCQYVFGVK